MPDLEELSSWRVREVVEAIGSTAAAPGGGAASAITIALAAACALKAVVLTLKHHPDAAGLPASAERLRQIADEALQGAADDATTFERLILAYQRPHASEAEAEARRAAIRDEAAVAAEIDERLKRLASEVKAIVGPLQGRVDDNVRTDLAAALMLAGAGERIQADNIALDRKAGSPTVG